MDGDHDENKYSNELHRLSEDKEPSDDDYERILQSILSAVGKPEATSYAEAEAKVRRLSSFRILHSIGSAVRSRAGVTVIAAGLLLTLLVCRILPERSLTTIPDEQVPLAGGPPPDAAASAGNRQYRVTEAVPAAPEGESSLGEDGDFPVMESFLAEEDILRIRVADSGSGVAWGKVYASDLFGVPVPPLEVDEREGIISFALPTESFELYLEDLAGNRSVVTVIAS